MRLTPKTIKEFLPLLTAFSEGKIIQYNYGTSDEPTWKDLCDANFDDPANKYRIKPVITRTPWTLADAKPVCWVTMCSGAVWAVSAWNMDTVVLGGLSPTMITYKRLMKEFKWSDDMKTWKPCCNEVEE